MNLFVNKLFFKRENHNKGFTLVELIIVVGMISTLSGIVLPSFVNWIRTEKVNSYTSEIREYFRIVRLEARRWGVTCQMNLNNIDYDYLPNNREYYGFQVNCLDDNSNIKSLAPVINNSVFQIMNKNFLITPNGRISSDKSIVIVIGSRYYSAGTRILNCLVIQAPTGHITRGKFIDNGWINNQMKVSQLDLNNTINANKCQSS